MTSMFDDQARHIAYIVAESMARGARTVEPTGCVSGQRLAHRQPCAQPS
jgi:hypothetical protein